MGREKLVVIGNGMAGMRSVEEVVGTRSGALPASPCSAPSRMSTTTASCCRRCWRATRSIDEIVINPPGWYGENGIRLFAGDSVVAIDRGAKTVTSASGRVEPYDRLLLATGSRPHRAADSGAGLPGVCAFRDIADVDK